MVFYQRNTLCITCILRGYRIVEFVELLKNQSSMCSWSVRWRGSSGGSPKILLLSRSLNYRRSLGLGIYWMGKYAPGKMQRSSSAECGPYGCSETNGVMEKHPCRSKRPWSGFVIQPQTCGISCTIERRSAKGHQSGESKFTVASWKANHRSISDSCPHSPVRTHTGQWPRALLAQVCRSKKKTVHEQNF
jgi:hypothetical protein